MASRRPLEDLVKIAQGPPKVLGEKLGPLSYVKVEARRLKNAKLIWLNWDLLDEMGFDTSRREMTSQLEKSVLDAMAFGIPGLNESKDAFSSETKLFYADRYGGDMLAGNMGSGRAASAGEIQSKGIGRTDLVTTIGSGHSNGLASVDEAMVEALYGEIGQRLPKGANRVLAIIDRGTTLVHENGRVQRNALIVRQDPLRPAHYLRNLYGRGPLMESEEARTQEALHFFLKAFPPPPNLVHSSEAEKVRGAVLAYADNVANVYAAAFVRKIYHGATSISNIEVDGRFIDYGTMTTVPDYGPLRRITGADPNGVTNELKSILMLEFLTNLRAEMPEKMRSRLPSDAEMLSRFESAYGTAMNKEFLLLTGLPESSIGEVMSRAEAKHLAELIERVATYGSKEALSPETKTYLTQYNVNRILIKFSKVENPSFASLIAILNVEIPTSDLWDLKADLVTSYLKVIGESRFERRDLVANAIERNAERSEGFAWDVWPMARRAEAEYVRTGSTNAIADRLDTLIAKAKSSLRKTQFCRASFPI